MDKDKVFDLVDAAMKRIEEYEKERFSDLSDSYDRQAKAWFDLGVAKLRNELYSELFKEDNE